jgi:hypothetical protein
MQRIKVVVLGALALGFAGGIGYFAGHRAAARELLSYHWYQLNLVEAETALQRTFIANDLHELPPEQVILKQEKYVAVALDAIGKLDMSRASYPQRANLEQSMRYVGRYYAKYPDAQLSDNAKRALSYHADAP